MTAPDPLPLRQRPNSHRGGFPRSATCRNALSRRLRPASSFRKVSRPSGLAPEQSRHLRFERSEPGEWIFVIFLRRLFGQRRLDGHGGLGAPRLRRLGSEIGFRFRPAFSFAVRRRRNRGRESRGFRRRGPGLLPRSRRLHLCRILVRLHNRDIRSQCEMRLRLGWRCPAQLRRGR